MITVFEKLGTLLLKSPVVSKIWDMDKSTKAGVVGFTLYPKAFARLITFLRSSANGNNISLYCWSM